MLKEEQRIVHTEDKKPTVVADRLADYSVNLIVRFWSTNADYWNLRWDMTKAVKEALDNAGIIIPYPVQTHIAMEDLNAQRKTAQG